MRYALLALAFAGSPAFATTIYDTFNEEDQQNLFDCCNLIPITAHTADTDKVEVAVPFTPEVFAKITEIDVGVSSQVPNLETWLRIAVAGSINGLPGREKKVWHHYTPYGEQCCEFLALKPGQAIHAEPVGAYWIVISSQHHSVPGGWNLNTIGASGPYAVKVNDGEWTMTSGPLPALRIIAK